MADPKSPFSVGNPRASADFIEETRKRRRRAIIKCLKRGLEPKQISAVIGLSGETISKDLAALRALYGVPTNHLLALTLVTGKVPEAATRKLEAIKLDIWNDAI